MCWKIMCVLPIAGPPSTIVLPAKKGPGAAASPASIAAAAAAAANSQTVTAAGGARNIIFAGNTLPQGAIPVQVIGSDVF